VLAWLSVWSEVQMICIWSGWCHCHPIISCFIKIHNGFTFWCWLTQVVLEKRPLNGCLLLDITVKNSSITTKHSYLILKFRSHHEIFVRRSWYSVLPSLDAAISCHRLSYLPPPFCRPFPAFPSELSFTTCSRREPLGCFFTGQMPFLSLIQALEGTWRSLFMAFWHQLCELHALFACVRVIHALCGAWLNASFVLCRCFCTMRLVVEILPST